MIFRDFLRSTVLLREVRAQELPAHPAPGPGDRQRAVHVRGESAESAHSCFVRLLSWEVPKTLNFDCLRVSY